MLKQLFETHISVSNLERSMNFYERIVGLQLGMLDRERRIAFYFIGGWNKSMLGLWEKPKAQVHEQHLAFEVALDDLERSIADLKRNEIDVLDFFSRSSVVPTVFAWMPAVGIYFRDPDGHLLEYIAKLPGEPQPERGVMTWDEWTAANEKPVERRQRIGRVD